MSHTIGSKISRANQTGADTFYQRGESLANLGHYPEALEAFDQAIAAYPSNTPKLAATWVFRAVVLLHMQSYDEALVSCDRALTLEPRNVEAWVFRGVALNYLGQYQDSYASYGKAMKLAQPQQSSPWSAFPSDLFSSDRVGNRPAPSKTLTQILKWRGKIRSKLYSLWQRLKHLRFHH